MSEGLPQGWTRHTLSGNTFYYHQRDNVWQREMPACPLVVPQLATPAPDSMLSQPEPEMPPPCPTPPSGRWALPGSFELQPVCPSPAAPIPQHACGIARAQPAANPTGNVAPAASPGAVVTSVIPPTQPPAAQCEQMTQLKVIVPSPGVAPGQLLAFTAPATPGQQPQQMAVALPDGAVHGSMVVVQYPSSNMQNPSANQSMQAPLLPQLSVSAQEEDRRASITSWCLYGVGWFCLCFCGPMAPCLWTIAAALYFCKPPGQRAQRPQQRVPARAALYTCLGVSCLAFLALIGVGAACLAGADCGKNSPGWHRHHHGGWEHGKFDWDKSYWGQHHKRDGPQSDIPDNMDMAVLPHDGVLAKPAMMLSLRDGLIGKELSLVHKPWEPRAGFLARQASPVPAEAASTSPSPQLV